MLSLPLISDAEGFHHFPPKVCGVPLLEKAWAKLHSSYQSIEAGLPSEALRAFTGAPTRHYRLEEAARGIPPPIYPLLDTGATHLIIPRGPFGQSHQKRSILLQVLTPLILNKCKKGALLRTLLGLFSYKGATRTRSSDSKDESFGRLCCVKTLNNDKGIDM